MPRPARPGAPRPPRPPAAFTRQGGPQYHVITGQMEWYALTDGSHAWNVTAAKRLVADGRPTNGDFDVLATAQRSSEADWAAVLSPEQRQWAVAHADLAQPILVVHAPFAVQPGEHPYIVIDGWHRIWRATVDHVALLEAHVLLEDEERQVRLW